MRKISVIVPVYNVEVYLEECISSILQQTYKEFELILLDDGSTDKSGIICDRFAQKNPEKIVVIHKENRGPLPTRICGIEHASGEIVVFLDSDDCMRKDALAQLAECFQTENCDMVLYDAGLCPDFSSRQISHPLENRRFFEKETKKELYQKLITYQIPNSVCLKAIKKDCTNLPKYFSRFVDVKHGEDLLMSACFLTNCQKIVYLNEKLYYYRNRPGSAIHSFDSKRKESIKVVHTELEKYVDDWGMPELKPLHNTRKVKGWVDTLLLLMQNRNSMKPKEFRRNLQSMAEDSYFREAYADMDRSRLNQRYSILAFCLIKKQYLLLYTLCVAAQAAKRIKFRRNHGR